MVNEDNQSADAEAYVPSGMRRGICFIDLEGTQYFAESFPEEFGSRIEKFYEEMGNYASLLGEAKVYMFSDCAFINFEDLNRFISFARAFRKTLFSQSIYFRCAVTEGDLQAYPARSGRREGRATVEVKSVVQGIKFGADTVKVYRDHSRFNGLGFTVASSLVSKNVAGGREDTFIDSWYLSKNTYSRVNSEYHQYCDIDYNLTNEFQLVIMKVLRDMAKVRSVQPSAAEKFIPLLYTLFKSYFRYLTHLADNNKLEFDIVLDKDLFLSKMLFKSKSIGYHLSKVRGAELLYALFLSEVLDLLDIGEKKFTEGQALFIRSEDANVIREKLYRLFETRQLIFEKICRLKAPIIHRRYISRLMENIAIE